MKTIIKYYEIVITSYHGEPIGRIRLDTGEESALYSIKELNNIIALMKQGVLLGSFAVDCILSDNATFQLVGE